MTWWKFWKKKEKKNKILTDPITVASLITYKLYNHEMPFYGWKPTSMVVPEKIAGIVTGAVWGYLIYLYLDIIRKKFGIEIKKIVKEYLLIELSRLGSAGDMTNEMLNHIECCLSNKETRLITSTEGYLIPSNEHNLAIYFLINTVTPYSISDENLEYFKKNDMPPDYFENADNVITECLKYAKQAAIETFTPILDFIEFKPESILGLNVNKFSWSDSPGCYERHLQRKYNNALFSPEKRLITQQEIDIARIKDNHDADDFKMLVLDYMNSSAQIRPNDDLQDFMNEQRLKIEDLEKRGLEIGGDIEPVLEMLKDQRTKLINAYRLAISNNQGAINLLNKAEEYYNNIYSKFLSSFLAQTERIDTPIIPEDIPAALLSEDIESIKKYKECLTTQELLDMLRKITIDTVRQMLNRNETVPKLKEKLNMLGIDFSELQKELHNPKK